MTTRPFKPPVPMRAILHGAAPPRFGEVQIRNRGRLPHWEKEAGLYFITFRLADSLPLPVLEKIAERQRILDSANRLGLKLLPDQKALIEEFSPRRLEEYFDRGAGACHLRDPRVAEVVADALGFFDDKRYRLMAWCIMPNHVHVVARLLPGEDLAGVLRSWKVYTARKANRILGRTGEFWQREYYDHLVRDAAELEHALQYIKCNPERAGLIDWKWVWSAGVDTRATAGLESGATRFGATN